MSRLVTHVTLAFVPLSEAWMYDVITAPVSYAARVLTPSRENEAEFPFEHVALLDPRARRGSPLWFHDNLHHRLGWPRTPANPWKRSLRQLAGPSTLFHAHYGLVGWHVVDAGLSPTVTSFYGFDASDVQILARWGEAYRCLFRAGAAFVAEGPAMRERLLAVGAPPERTHVIPLIANLEGDWEPPSLETDLPTRVLMAGRLVEKKGFVEGIAAFGAARRAGADARLLIMGAGPEEDRLRLAVRSQGLEEHVDFLPPRPRDEFRDVVRSCQLIFQPSRTASDGDAEGGAPTTLLEAQALGRVVVATDHADIPNVVDPGAAFLAPEGDVEALAAGLIRALGTPDEWPSRGAAGRRFVETHHSRGHVATLLEQLYDGVAGNEQRPRRSSGSTTGW